MSVLCKFKDCITRAIFGYDKNKVIYCKKHKEINMIDVKHKKCKCDKSRPTFGYESDMKAICCKLCKNNDMINVIDKKCLCNKSRPIFGYESDMKAICCKLCKKENMIDVLNKKCQCNKSQPTFGYESDMKVICCKLCKKNDMINITDKKCLCDKSRPIFGYESDMKAICCKLCKKKDMIDVNKKCKNYICIVRGNNKYKGYCTYCFSHLFPLDPLTFQIRNKTKELTVRDFINSNYDGFYHDKPLEYGGCDCTSRRRIDHRKIINNTMIAIETDEFQHKSYNEKDEENRYNDLVSLFTCKWYFIRFNPDNYKDKNGKNKNPEISTRLKKLKEEIDKAIKIINKDDNKELITIIKLFYDEK